MSPERFPKDLLVTTSDFAICGWEEVLAATTREGYHSLWQAFSLAAKQAIEEGRKSHGKVLWLLADACSMMLSPKSFNEPYRPILEMEGKRSSILDDFSDSDIGFFAQIVDLIDDPYIRGRLADIVWLKGKPREVKFAQMAIDAFRSIPLDKDTWVRGGAECWDRAIGLARMLRGGDGNRLKEMESKVLAVIIDSSSEEDFLPLKLADFLASKKLGSECRAVIARKLESMGKKLDGDKEIFRARELFRASSDWWRADGNEKKSAAMTMALAECWVKEAKAKTEIEARRSYMIAGTFLENAIQTLRTIPHSERATHRVNERISDLRGLLSEFGEKSLEEMSVIRTPEVDISKMIENARNAVKGKNPVEALRSFVNLQRGADFKDMRENAIEKIRKHPLLALFPATVMSPDGRVIAKHPGLTLGEELSEEDETVIRAEMVRDYNIFLTLVVQGAILPALEGLLIEHRLREQDFVGLAMQSPIIPKSREQLFGKALFAGYDRDFVTALHLLIPQIEHMVRYHLKQAGAKTTTLDCNGIETENGLSTLMNLPEAVKAFGQDLCFELNTLLCDPFGPNLRNEIAHGLMDETSFHSVSAIYVWWLGLRLVFNAFWNKARESTEKGKDGDGK